MLVGQWVFRTAQVSDELDEAIDGGLVLKVGIKY